MEYRDLGFGKKSAKADVRFVNKDGGINVFRKGLPFFRPYDFYHALISMSWTAFLGMVTLGFFLINIIFALLYEFLENNAITALDKSSKIQHFWDAFFFSVQTMTTVGYGAMSPISNGAKIVSSIESFIGLLGFALITGLLYGRFSRPATKIKYSENALIAPFKEGKALMFKMANQRSSKLIEAEVTVVFIGNKNGQRIYQNLELQLNKINFFALSWTVVHPIDENSILFNETSEGLADKNAEIVILVKAFDDSFSQTVYSRMSYKYDEFVWNASFNSSLFEEDGKMGIKLNNLNDYTVLN